MSDYYERAADLVEFAGLLPSFGAIGAGASVEVSFEVPTYVPSGSVSMASPSTDLGNANLTWCARVGSGLAYIRVSNPTAAPITPSNVSWRIFIRIPRESFDLDPPTGDGKRHARPTI